MYCYEFINTVVKYNNILIINCVFNYEISYKDKDKDKENLLLQTILIFNNKWLNKIVKLTFEVFLARVNNNEITYYTFKHVCVQKDNHIFLLYHIISYYDYFYSWTNVYILKYKY